MKTVRIKGREKGGNLLSVKSSWFEDANLEWFADLSLRCWNGKPCVETKEQVRVLKSVLNGREKQALNNNQGNSSIELAINPLDSNEYCTIAS